MESLYRKYRPLTFDSVVGQQHIVSTLEHAVSEGRLSHAYLFCGPRGTGKTTMARILAKALLCEHAAAARAEGASGCMPDGDCPECQAIAEGTHPDVYELDAASRTGVDNVREEIVNSVSFAPVRGAYKVYIIDEVHMLTTAAFNALLKTLEEPPSHVVFILCTTDPQKILETILSRCQRFDFHRISNEDLVGRMRFICEQEGFAFDDEALEIVAKHARGGMRDALSTLEQLSVFGDGAVRAADARALLGEVASTVLAEFACKIAVRDTVGLFDVVRAQVDEGNDLLELTRDLVGHMRDVYTVRIAGPKPELLDGTPEEVAALAEEAKLFESADRLARTLTVLDDAALEMRGASDPRLVLEIALTRLARPEGDLTLEALAERIARLEAQIAAGVPSGPMGAERLTAAAGANRTGSGAAAAPVAGAATAVGAAVQPSQPQASSPTSFASQVGKQPESVQSFASMRDSQTRPAAAEGPVPAPAAARAETAPAASVAAASVSSFAAPRPATAPAPSSAAAHSAAAPVPSPTAAVGSVRNPADGAAAAGRSGFVSDAPVPSASKTPVDRASAGGSPVPGSGVSAPSAPSAPSSAASAPSASAAVQVACAGAVETPAVSDPGELQRKWAEVVQRVVSKQPSRGALLQSSRAQADDGLKLTIGFPAGSNFAIKMLGRADSHELVLPIVCSVFGKRSVEYVMDGGPTGVPASAPVAPSASGSAASGRGSGAAEVAPVGAASQNSASATPRHVGASSASARAMPATASAPLAGAPSPQAATLASPASSPTEVLSSPASVSPDSAAPAPSAAAVTTPESASAPTASNDRKGPVPGASSPAQPAATAAATRAATSPASPTGETASSAPAMAGGCVAVPSASEVSASKPMPSSTGAAVPVSSSSTPAPSSALAAAASPVSAPSAVDQVSGPTIVPEPDIDAQRRAWEDEPVPYDEATIAAYTEDEEIPPFDIPADVAPVAHPSAPAPTGPGVANDPGARSASSSSIPAASPAPAAASGSGPVAKSQGPHQGLQDSASAPASADGPGSGSNPFNHPGADTRVPETTEEAKSMLGDIFGAGIVFKDA